MGLLGRLFGGGRSRPSYSNDLRIQIDKAMASLQTLTAAHDGIWQISQAAWSVDQSAGTIAFTSPKGIVATAPVQIIGSYSTQDGSWLWAWDNLSSIKAELTEHARKARSYGQEHGYDILTTPKLACPEETCWDFAALACMLAGAQGAYRGPAGPVRVFMTFGDVKLTRAS